MQQVRRVLGSVKVMYYIATRHTEYLASLNNLINIAKLSNRNKTSQNKTEKLQLVPFCTHFSDPMALYTDRFQEFQT
jgi:ribosomal protein L33